MSSTKKGLFRHVSFRSRNLHDDEKCYCNDTINHMKINEKQYTHPAANMAFIPGRDNVDYCRRCTLHDFRTRIVEWLIQIQDYFTNCEETLEMAVCLFDFTFFKGSYLDLTEYNGEKFSYQTKDKHYCLEERLHLTALTCYFISCKFWERFPPKANKLIHLTEYGYNVNQLFCMEREILMSLEFDLNIPLVSQYIELYMLHEEEYLFSRMLTVCHYLSNLLVTEMMFANHPSSSLAAVILQLSKMILNVFSAGDENGNEPSFQQVSNNYDEGLFHCEDFYEILKDVYQIFITSVTSDSFKVQKKKFSEQKYSYLSLYMETIDLQLLEKNFQDLTCEVQAAIELRPLSRRN